MIILVQLVNQMKFSLTSVAYTPMAAPSVWFLESGQKYSRKQDYQYHIWELFPLNRLICQGVGVYSLLAAKNSRSQMMQRNYLWKIKLN